MQRSLLLLPLLAALLPTAAPPPARAGEPAAALPTPREQALQGLDMVMQGLRRIIEQVPLYGPPEIAPNGDIIMRRLTPGEPKAPEPPSPAAAPEKMRL
ncbi:MAG: hypothetical protein WCO00_07915 [Rhodospirillaceae bacterium]